MKQINKYDPTLYIKLHQIQGDHSPDNVKLIP